MKRHHELPIEALPEPAFQRIERAVFDELALPEPRVAPSLRGSVLRYGAVALVGVLALQLAGAALFWLTRGDGAKPRALASTRLSSFEQASETTIGDVAIRLEPRSTLIAVENGAHDALIVLEHGAARFSVPHRGERPAFVVQAGDTRVEVVGTQFRVERAGSSARVDAYEGKVRVSAQGESRLLTRGQHWPERATAPAPMPTATPNAGHEPAPEATERATEEGPRRDSPRRRFEQAAALEAKDAERALRIYGSLADEKSAWGDNALYAMARLELELGREARATRLLQRYIDRHPDGANATDARALLAKIKKEGFPR